MFEQFTERARQAVVLAQEEARALEHNYIGTEHMLLGLLREREGVAARVLGSLDITVERVRSHVIRLAGPSEELIPRQIPFTPRAKRLLELALREAATLGHDHVGTEHMLLGVVRGNEGRRAGPPGLRRRSGHDSRSGDTHADGREHGRARARNRTREAPAGDGHVGR